MEREKQWYEKYGSAAESRLGINRAPLEMNIEEALNIILPV